MKYVRIFEDKINSIGEVKLLDAENIEISDELYADISQSPDKYIWDSENQMIIENPDYESLLVQKEAERIAMLNLTGADVERAIYKARGMDFDDIISYLEAQPLVEDGQPVVDIKALKIELKANNFYRGNPYVEQIGQILGFTDEQLTKFFETNDYTKLIESEV